MNTRTLLIGDYRKWLLYAFGKQELSTYAELFKALQSGQPHGTINVTITPDGSRVFSHEKTNEELQLTAEQQQAFAQYLVQNYFHTERVDDLIAEKREETERVSNHSYLNKENRPEPSAKESYTIKPHPKEITYFNIKLVISVLIYLSLVGLLVIGALTDLSLLFSALLVIPVFIVVWLLRKIAHGIFVGIIKGESVQVTPHQFPEIYNIVEEQARALGLKKIPEIYITSGHFNAFVTNFSRAHILMLYSEVVETAMRGNYDVLKYVTAHELSHVRRKHLARRMYLLPSSIVPFLNLAYSRGCEYTCDRVGYSFSPQGSVEGILIMTTGKEIYSRLNVEQHIKNAQENEGFWSWLSEKFLTHPHHYKRLIEIKKYSQYN
jgi:Zn-dependent protease with chaperone function